MFVPDCEIACYRFVLTDFGDSGRIDYDDSAILSLLDRNNSHDEAPEEDKDIMANEYLASFKVNMPTTSNKLIWSSLPRNPGHRVIRMKCGYIIGTLILDLPELEASIGGLCSCVNDSTLTVRLAFKGLFSLDK